MKKCVPSITDRIITLLSAIVCAIIACWAFRTSVCEEQAFAVFSAIGLLFAGTAIHILWRTIYMGNWGFFYNDETIVFVLSRKDRWQFRWDELKNSNTNIFYPSSPASWYFYFQDGKKTKKIAVTPRMTGYDDFVDMLKKKGFPAGNPGTFSFDAKNAAEIFHQVFGEDFGKDRKNGDK